MVEVVYDKELTPSGMIMNRVAKIDGQFYPYRFDMNSAQVTRGSAFAKHSEAGIKYVSEAYDTLDEAVSAL